MKRYSTEDRASDQMEDVEPIKFQVDEDTFVATAPTQTQFAIFLSTQAERREWTERIAGVVDFFDGLLDEDSRRVFRRRLLDRDDHLDFAMVDEIMEDLMTEWLDRPTMPGSDSSSSVKPIGRSSTAKRRSTA